MKNSEVLGIGNALLDCEISIPHSFLEKRNITPGSMTLAEVDFQKDLIEQIKKETGQAKLHWTSGGCAANTLTGFASYGGKGRFVGKTGSDENGVHYRDDLKAASVDYDLRQNPQIPTGTCLALITPDAERTMFTNLGAAITLTADDITKDEIEQTNIVYIEGYLWDSTSAREASIKTATLAKELGKKVAFTFSDPFCVGRYTSEFKNFTQNFVDILFCNEDESKTATGLSDTREAFKELKNWCEFVAVTCGSKGVLVGQSSKNEIEEIGTWKVKLVDKLGAGDLFAAGMLFGITKNYSLREAGLLGSYSATRIIQQYGGRIKTKLADEIAIGLAGPQQIEEEPYRVKVAG